MQSLQINQRYGYTVPLAAHRAEGNPLSRIYAKTLILLLPLVLIGVAISPDDWDFVLLFNRGEPFYLIGIMIFSAYRIIRAVPDSIWSPAALLPIQTAVFFGFGPLVEVYGNFETQLRLTEHKLNITEGELFGANYLTAVAVFGVILGFWLHTECCKPEWRAALDARLRARAPVLKPDTLVFLFVGGGVVLRYGIIQPAQWGMLEILVPGVFATMAHVLDVGFALAAYLAGRGDKRMQLLLLLLLPLHVFLTVLTFSKSQLMLALLLPAIGSYLAHRKIRRLTLAVIATAVVFTYSQDFVSFGRSLVMEQTGTVNKAGYAERLMIAGRYFTEGRNSVMMHPDAQREDWWMRLNYANVQAVAMGFYDNGAPGSTLKNAWQFFIPRAIWPGKPLLVPPGETFRELITGRPGGGAVGLSVYGDLYWQFGWYGVVLITPLIGWLFAMMSWRSIEMISRRDFIYIPAVLIALQTTVAGLTKFLSNGIIAAIPMYFSYLLMVTLLSRFLKAEQNRLREANR